MLRGIFSSSQRDEAFTTPWARREPGGIYVGHDKSVWMYRQLPLTPLQWEDPEERLAAGNRLSALLDELGATSKPMAGGMRMLSRNREVHLFGVTYDTYGAPPASTPELLRPFLTEILDDIVTGKALLIGIKLRSTATAAMSAASSGGMVKQAKAALSMAGLDSAETLEAFRTDISEIDAIVRKHSTRVPTKAALAQLESWYNRGLGPDAAIASASDRLHVSGGDTFEMSALMRFENAVLHAPHSQWLLEAMTHNAGACVVSVRAELEPHQVTRARVRQSQRKVRAQMEEEEATGDIEREENSDTFRLAREVENFVRTAREPLLASCSVLFARRVYDNDNETFLDYLRSAYAIEAKPLEHRQLAALDETLPCSSKRVNPFPQDLSIGMVAHAGLPSFSTLGDETGVLVGRVDPDYVPFYLNPYGAPAANKPPVMGVFGQPGSGKAQPLDAKVLTPAGWRLMGELAVGDDVIGSDGCPTRVVGIFPQGQRPIYRVTFNDGSSTRCDEEHLWTVATSDQRSNGRDWRVLSTAELRDSLRDSSGKLRWRIPVIAPVQFPHSDLPIDPYLLGVLLGDGNFTHHVNFSTADAEILDAVRAALPAGLHVKHLAGIDYQIQASGPGRPHPFKAALRELGLFGLGALDKHIPAAYLRASVPQRVALLQGLMDSDGEAVGGSKSSSIIFNTSSPQLVAGVTELTQSLGGTVRVNGPRLPKYQYKGEYRVGAPAWRVSLCLPAEVIPFRLGRKLELVTPRVKYRPCRVISSIEFDGHAPAQCIKVAADDQLYATDDYLLTHNTFACQLIAAQAALAGISVIMINPKGYDTLRPFAQYVGLSAPSRVVSMRTLEEQGGAFDPFRFCDPQAAAEIATSHILTVLGNGKGLTGKQEILLGEGLSRGAEAGARCVRDALAHVEDPEIIDLVLSQARASTLFSLAIGNVEQPEWTDEGGLTLIEFDREMPLPDPGKDASSYERDERIALAAMRLVTRASMEILMKAEGGVLIVDEAHTFLSSPEGLKSLQRIGREGRSLNLLPIFATQRIADVMNADLEGYLSRVLVMALADPTEAYAALKLCGLEPTNDRIEFLRECGPRRPSEDGPGRGALAFHRDLNNRHSVVTIGPVPEHVRLAFSTNPEDRKARRDAEEAASDVDA